MPTREHRTILLVWPVCLVPRHMDLYLALNEKSTSKSSQESIFTHDYSFSLNQFHSSANFITALCLLLVKYLISTGPKRDSSRSPGCHPKFNSWRCPRSPTIITCKLKPTSLIFSMNSAFGFNSQSSRIRYQTKHFMQFMSCSNKPYTWRQEFIASLIHIQTILSNNLVQL